jgi:hypothetical protein
MERAISRASGASGSLSARRHPVDADQPCYCLREFRGLGCCVQRAGIGLVEISVGHAFRCPFSVNTARHGSPSVSGG